MIYIRCTDLKGSHINSLLCSKSRVAPIKVVSLLRLELYVEPYWGTRLTTEFITAMGSWLKVDPSLWKFLITNRVAAIQRLTGENQWYQVKSENNPADLVSKGLSPELLKGWSMWWIGPSWLSREVECDLLGNMVVLEKYLITSLFNKVS